MDRTCMNGFSPSALMLVAASCLLGIAIAVEVMAAVL